MTTETDLYLTDEFVTFSQGIKGVHEAKKHKQDEIKKLFEQAKLDIKKLDDEAAELKAGWDKFVVGHSKADKKDAK